MKKYLTFAILAFLTSCFWPAQKNYNFEFSNCDDYEFLLDFLHSSFERPNNISDIKEFYPLYISKDVQKTMVEEINSQNFDLSKIYKNDKSSIALTDQFCGEVGEKDGLHNPDYFNKVILLKFRIKQHNKFIYVKFIQKYPKMYCELKEFEITDEDRALEAPKE